MHLILEDARKPGWRIWSMAAINNVLLGKIQEPVWYTIYHQLPVVQWENKPLYNQPTNGKRTSIAAMATRGHCWDTSKNLSADFLRDLELKGNKNLSHIFWLVLILNRREIQKIECMNVLHRCHKRGIPTKSSWWCKFPPQCVYNVFITQTCLQSPTRHVFAGYTCTSWANMLCT